MTPAERIRRCLGRWEPSMVPTTANEGYARAEMNLRKLYDAPPVPHIDPDWLANFIRRSDPRMTMTSDELAEKIADAINGRAK